MQDTVAAPTVQVNDEKKTRKYLVGIVVLAIATLAGVGFGVYGMVMKGQTDDKVGALNSELERKDEALKQVEEKLGTKIEIGAEGEQDLTSNANVPAAKDYIYIGEWGIKIKIPETLHSVSYVFYGGKDLLYVSGVTCGNGRCQYYPAFMENIVGNGTGLGALSRYRKDDSNLRVEEQDGAKLLVYNGDGYTLGPVVYEDNEYYLCYSHSQAAYGTESEQEWEIESADAVQDMLRHGVSAF